ncbi:MAG: hypothetical protein R3275_07185 [Saprospiraceae bacterium]|nr:hypothetical protein [Saprospiraceae bacterium]
MKSFILFFLLTLPAAVFTQHEEGKITYTETMKMDMEIPEEHKEELQGLFPETSSTEKVLLFNREESIYKNVEDQGDEVVEAGSEESGMRIKMVMSRPDLQLYKNLKKKEMIQ